MSLFEDILKSDKVKSFVKKNDSFQPIYDRLTDNYKKKNKLSPEEQLDEDYKFSNIVKKESSLMSIYDKKRIINDELIDNPINHSHKVIDKHKYYKYKKYAELEFFNTNNVFISERENDLFSKINKTQTLIGKSQLMNIICHTTNDINILNERKAVLNLVENFTNKITKEQSNITDELLDDIKSIKDCEDDVLWFFKDSSNEMKNMLDMIYFSNFWNKWVNNRDKLLNIFYYCKLILIPLYGLLIPFFLIVIPFIFIKKLLKIKIPFRTYWKIIRKVYLGGGGISATITHFFNIYSNMKGGGTNQSYLSITNLIVKFVKLLINSNITKYIYIIFTFCSYIYGIYSTLNHSYSYLKIIQLFQSKLHKVSKLIIKIQEIYNRIGCLDSSELEAKYENKLDFLNDPNLQLLNDDVFRNKPSYIFSNKGLILKQFLLIKQNPDCLKNYILYLGDIDAIISNLVLKRELNMIIPEYENKDKPNIDVEGFYNLMIPKDKSVTNDIIVNDSSDKKHKQNIIITGPNASGKSTFLKALTEVIIMAQTICVVPATKLHFTPFKYINTYLNIPDCQGKESLFQAEMSRCYEQIENFKTIKDNEFVFSIMDEIFVSTNYNEGLSGAYAIAKKMASFKNSICIISTHFSKLSEYCGNEKDNCYSNYHFSIDEFKKNSTEKNNNSKIFKSYKIKNGRSKQHIALEMLQEKGFDNDLICNAKKMYSELVEEEKKVVNKTQKKLTKKKKKT